MQSDRPISNFKELSQDQKWSCLFLFHISINNHHILSHPPILGRWKCQFEKLAYSKTPKIKNNSVFKF
jgi:hypothetical protein